jgi:SAM-dependent methyltransferase
MSEAERIRVIAREGYDLWAESYDATPNPVVALDTRHTIEHLPPQDGERILDAGCGTGRNLQALLDEGVGPVEVGFSKEWSTSRSRSFWMFYSSLPRLMTYLRTTSALRQFYALWLAST